MSNDGKSIEHGYRVEVRDTSFTHHHPTQLHDGIIGPEWREVLFESGCNPAGIPQDSYGQKHAHSLITHEGAMALAWTIIAQTRRYSIEVRLVQYRLETTYKCERSGVVDMPTITLVLRGIPLVSSPDDPTQP